MKRSFSLVLVLVLAATAFTVVNISATGNEKTDTCRYYFYLPEEWDNEDATATIYWWNPKYADEAKSMNKTDTKGLYYYDVPTNAESIAFGNSLDLADVMFENRDSDTKYVTASCRFNKDKVFVVDFDKTYDHAGTGRTEYTGNWYYNYGDGAYGTTVTKGEEFFSCRSFGGDNPAPVVETNRYYFYMPEDWDNVISESAHIYWWEGTDNSFDYWPGYYAHSDNISGLYYYDVPKDVTTIIWSNGATDNTGIYDMFTSPAKQTPNINTEGYKAGECELYPDGIASFDNMIYVMNYDELYTELEGTTAGGSWYYYYGDGEYGTTPEKGDVVYSTRQLGDIPNIAKTHPAEGEMTLYVMHNEWLSPVFINYTSNGEALSKELTFMAENRWNTLSYVNIPQDAEKVHFSAGDAKTYDIKRNLVHNGCFSFGEVVGDRRDYKSYLLNEQLQKLDYLLGDATRDGKLNIKDATLIQKYLAKMEFLLTTGKDAADFNQDGKISIKDATAIQKFLAFEFTDN